MKSHIDQRSSSSDVTPVLNTCPMCGSTTSTKSPLQEKKYDSLPHGSSGRNRSRRKRSRSFSSTDIDNDDDDDDDGDDVSPLPSLSSHLHDYSHRIPSDSAQYFKFLSSICESVPLISNMPEDSYENCNENDNGSGGSNVNNNSYETLSQLSFNNGYYRRFFKEEKFLGRGSFGSVFLTHHILDDVNLGYYAVKIIPVGDSHSFLMKVLKEVRALERLKHPNIVDYKHRYEDLNFYIYFY